MRHVISIDADDRERPSGIPDLLRAEAGVAVNIRRLALGDYLVNGRFLFERKTFQDFALSIVDGRLFRQARRLANCRWRPVVFLEGTALDLESIHVTWEALQGGLIATSLIFGIPVLRSRTPAETARLLIYSAMQEARHATGLTKRPGYRPHSKAARQRYILQGLPGIGPIRASQLLERFGGVEAVMTAGAPELAEVAGIGLRTAELIRETVQESGESYAANGAPP